MIYLEARTKPEIRKSISWLKAMRDDINNEIKRLEDQAHAIEAKKQRKIKRAEYNLIISDILEGKLDGANADLRLMQYGVEPKHVKEVFRLMKSKSDVIKRKHRDAEIYRRIVLNGETKTALAAEYGISRKQIHVIYNKMKKSNQLLI